MLQEQRNLNIPSNEELGYNYDENKPVSIKSLSQAFDRGIEKYQSMTRGQRRIEHNRIQSVLLPYLKTDRDGKINSLLSTNRKQRKAQEKEDLLLPTGDGVETTGLSLAPAYQHGKLNTCPNRTEGCEGSCLGKTSGSYFLFGGGVAGKITYQGNAKMAYLRRTHALIMHPEEFAIKLHTDISVAHFMADMRGNKIGVRLNTLSDLHPRVFKSIILAHPDVDFYDYTKNNIDPIAPNHKITYSSTGISQPAGYNGVKEDIHNPNQNWKQMRRRLEQGHNVAMSFSHQSILPKIIHDEETGKTYDVIDGDDHDYRPIDGRGVIVGLRNKDKTTKQENAAKVSNGFFVHYDPQVVKKAGSIVRDSDGNPIVRNSSVTIPRQSRPAITINNDGEKE